MGTKKSKKRPDLSSIIKKRWADPAYRKRLSEAHRKRWADPKLREEMSRKVKAAHTPEVCLRKSRSHKLLFKDPAYSKRMHEAWRRKASEPEQRTRRSENSKRMWADPEYKKRVGRKIARAQARPETRAKHKRAILELWDSTSFRRKVSSSHKKNWSDTEFKERHLEKLRSPEVKEKQRRAWTKKRRAELGDENRANSRTDLRTIRIMVGKACPSLLVKCKNFKDYQSKLRIICRRCGTITTTTWDKFRQIEWVCRTCTPHKFGASEKEVRKVVEEVTGWKFPKTKPKWLNGLELDGYNEKHEVAFEYQGECHYKPIFGKVALTSAKLRDDRKRKMCEYNDVLLIRIPYWKTEEQVRDLVERKLEERK